MGLSSARTNITPTRTECVMFEYGIYLGKPARRNVNTGEISHILWHNDDPSRLYQKKKNIDNWISYELSWWNGFDKYKPI